MSKKDTHPHFAWQSKQARVLLISGLPYLDRHYETTEIKFESSSVQYLNIVMDVLYYPLELPGSPCGDGMVEISCRSRWRPHQIDLWRTSADKEEFTLFK